MRCCASCEKDLGRHLCGSCDGSCDLGQGLFGKHGLSMGSSKPAPSQVLLPGQQQERRTLSSCREQQCVKL